MIVYDDCPLCGNSSIRKIFTAQDFTVSRESFEIWQCEACTGRFTQDIPDARSISAYYQSEDYISHSNIKIGFANRIYHAVRNHTLSGKRRLVERYSACKKGNLLDIGSGTGAFLNEMKQEGWKISGIEPDPGARQKANDLYQIKIDSPERLRQYAEGSFDAITLWHVLEHMHNLHAEVEQLKKLIGKSGLLYIAVPNFESYDAKTYGKYWAAYDVPRHLYHFSPASMKKLIANHQLKLVTEKPMWFDSFYISMLSEKYKSGKTNLLKASWRGFISNLNAFMHHERCSSLIYIVGK